MSNASQQRILVLGAGGQLGRELMRASVPSAVIIHGLRHSELDISNAPQVLQKLQEFQPSVVINCASFTAVDRAEREIQQSFDANTQGAAAVARACEETGAHLLHISTEYIFDGLKDQPYTEDDEPSPLNIYGQCKAEAERQVRLLAQRHVIVRTSWLFSSIGGNFVRTILKLAAEKDELRVVDDQYGCPTPAADLAAVLLNISRQLFDGKSEGFGTFHYCGAAKASRYEFAGRIIELARPYLINAPFVIPVSQTQYPTPAQRPPHCILDCAKIGHVYGIEQKAWDTGLMDVIRELHLRVGE